MRVYEELHDGRRNHSILLNHEFEATRRMFFPMTTVIGSEGLRPLASALLKAADIIEERRDRR